MPTYDRVTVVSVDVEAFAHHLGTTGISASATITGGAVAIPYGITAVYDDLTKGTPVFWDTLAVVEGKFGAVEGLVYVEGVQASVQSWTDTKIEFIPVKGGLAGTASQDVHVHRPL